MAATKSADALIVGRIRTMDPAHPVAGAMLVRAGRVVAVGDAGEFARTRASVRWDLPDGAVAVPGFEDAHMHLLATAGALLSVDCSAGRAGSVSAIVDVLRRSAGCLPAGTWVRGFGYDDALLAERGHLTRAALDRVSGGHPVVVHHRNGHVAVANSAALAELQIAIHHAGDDGAGVARDAAGYATGVLAGPALRPNGTVPPARRTDLVAALDSVSIDLARRGVTSITDASSTNNLSQLELCRDLARREILRQRLTLMPDAPHLDDIAEADFTYGSGDDRVRLGPVKLEPNHDLSAGDLPSAVRDAHRRGWPVAMHVDDAEPLERALVGLEDSPAPPGTRDRLDHVLIAQPGQLRRLARVGAAIVTHPSFVLHRGDTYLSRFSTEEQGSVLATATPLGLGITVAAASDSPAAPADPLEIIQCAVQRRTRTGRTLGAAQRVDAATALALLTVAPGALGLEQRGVLTPGAAADFVVLTEDPVTAAPAGLAAIRALATFRGGHRIDDMETVPFA